MKTALNVIWATLLAAPLSFGVNHLLGLEQRLPLAIGIAAGVSFMMSRKAEAERKAKGAEPSA